MDHAEPPPPPSQPAPPTTAEAARIVNAAWHDLDYGRMVWTGMVTGARLGELCALRWHDFQVEHVDPGHVRDGLGGYDCLEQGCHWVLSISRSIEHLGLNIWETDTKPTSTAGSPSTPRRRRCFSICARSARRTPACRVVRVSEDDFIFHHRRGPDVCLRPGAVSTHYRRFTAKLGITTTFHKLRHYSATELITAGVDIRTVAGRLGHSGGGTTTLKVYAAWVAEADQRPRSPWAAECPRLPSVTRPPGRERPPDSRWSPSGCARRSCRAVSRQKPSSPP
jgi:integrase